MLYHVICNYVLRNTYIVFAISSLIKLYFISSKVKPAFMLNRTDTTNLMRTDVKIVNSSFWASSLKKNSLSFKVHLIQCNFKCSKNSYHFKWLLSESTKPWKDPKQLLGWISLVFRPRFFLEPCWSYCLYQVLRIFDQVI